VEASLVVCVRGAVRCGGFIIRKRAGQQEALELLPCCRGPPPPYYRSTPRCVHWITMETPLSVYGSADSTWLHLHPHTPPPMFREGLNYATYMVRHPRCVFINYNWINQLSNTTFWWLDICCLLHRYQLQVSALMAIFRLID